MLAPEMFETQFRFSAWADGKLLDLAEGLPDAELDRERGKNNDTLREILMHLVLVQRGWQGDVIRGEDRDDVHRLLTIPELRAIAEGNLREVLTWLAGQSDESLSERYTVGEGGEERVRWQVLFHILNHNAQHRAEAALWLTELDRSPGDLDDLDWIHDIDGK